MRGGEATGDADRASALEAHHRALEDAVAHMRGLIARETLDADAVTRVRLALSRGSIARTRFLNEAVYPVLIAGGGAAATLAHTLRDAAAADRGRSSAHVAKWSTGAVAADWAGFRHDAAAILDMMTARIARERALSAAQRGAIPARAA